MRSLVAVTTAVAFLATGCAAQRPWPAQPVAVSMPAFASSGGITTIDVLPLDFQVWGEDGYGGELPDLRAAAEVNLMNVALETLARRNYTVGATIDWNGDFAGGNALSRDDLVATLRSLARYGATAAAHPGQLPVPALPVRLGTATGSDATLYVGGWAYVARPRESTGDQIAKGVLIAVLVLSVVAIVALLVSNKKSSGGGRGGNKAHDLGRGRSRASASASRAHAARGIAGAVDAVGRVAIDVAVVSSHWDEQPTIPDGAESQMYLEMTLVDNRTGLALWHARQSFPASAASASETARVAHTVLSLLPGRTTP